MTNYPLYFDFKQVIPGPSFFALIEAKGKVLMVEEDRKYWLYGVQPGGMAASGNTVDAGLKKFNIVFKNVLLDIAEGAEDIEDFKKEVQNFFNSVDKTDETAWETARDKIRAEMAQCPEDIDKLRKETSDLDCTIDIVCVRNRIPKRDILSEGDLYQCAA